MVNNSEFYASKIVYQDLAKVVPGFDGIGGGSELSFGDKGNPSIVLKAIRRPSPSEKIEQIKKGIATPYPMLTQASREVASVFMHLTLFSVNLLCDYLKLPNPERQMKGDFHLCVLDFEKQIGYSLTVNHQQGRAVLDEAFEVERKQDGNLQIGKPHFLNLADFHEVVTASDFAKHFSRSRSVLKGSL